MTAKTKSSPKKAGAPAKADKDATAIGKAYKRGKVAYIQAGKMLAAKKKSLGYGEWLPWLKANAKVLGFGDWTAQRLIRLAQNPSWDMEKVWGNDIKKAKAAKAATGPSLATSEGKEVDNPYAIEAPAGGVSAHEDGPADPVDVVTALKNMRTLLPTLPDKDVQKALMLVKMIMDELNLRVAEAKQAA
jgi:DUF3102 family protein